MSDDRELRDELERLQAEARNRTGRLQEVEATAARLENELQRITAERDRLAELLIALRSGRPVTPAARKGKPDGRVFRGGADAIRAVLEEARAFARRFPPELLLDITHSDDRDEVVVVVWHVGPPRPEGMPLTPLSFELVESPPHQRWENTLSRTAEVIARLGADRIVCLGHSEDANRGTIALWYWGD